MEIIYLIRFGCYQTYLRVHDFLSKLLRVCKLSPNIVE